MADERRGAALLLVEDNLVNQAVATGMLEHLGHSVNVAGNGREAFEVLGQASYDLIFMDCQMPEMDGYEATKVIRQQEQEAAGNSGNGKSAGVRIPIIALTANALAGAREECLAAGMDDYLAKPFNETQLAALLSRWLPAKTAARTEQAKPKQAPAPAIVRDDAPPAERRSAAPAPAIVRDNTPVIEQKTAMAAPENAEVSVIDEHALNRIRAVQPELVEKVINIYSKDAPQLMTAISDAIAQSDPEALKKAAHTLKSSSANVGAVTLAELCKTLEMMGREKAIEKADEVAGKLSGEYSRVLAALNKHLGETNSAMLQ